MALTKGIGKQIQVGIAKEVTRGTAITTAAYWLPVDDWMIEEKYENAVDAQTYGVIEDNVGQTRTKKWAEGELKVPVTGTSTAVLLHALFGTATAALHAGESTLYDNTYNVLQTVQHKSLTLFVHDPIPTATGATSDYTHANAIVTKADIEYSLGNWVTITYGVRAQAGSAAAVVFVPSQSVTENRFVPQYMTFKLASTFSGLTAASAIKIKSAKITIEKNATDDDVLGQTAPRDFLNQEFSIEGDIEAIWQNESDFKDASLANTAKAMRLDLVNTDVSMGAAATNPQLRLDLARVHFTDFSRPIKIKEVVYQTVHFKAAYSVTDGLMARALFVTNIVA